jgi:hypothetical protein
MRGGVPPDNGVGSRFRATRHVSRPLHDFDEGPGLEAPIEPRVHHSSIGMTDVKERTNDRNRRAHTDCRHVLPGRRSHGATWPLHAADLHGGSGCTPWRAVVAKLVVPTGLRAIATAILAAEMGPAIAEAAPAGAPLH